MTYHRILVPVDNSRHSDAAVQTAADWAVRLGSTVVGFHVYAARLHETRFRQMESGLPEPYRAEAALQHQRSVHETLIGEGLCIISESYLDHAEELCRAVGAPYQRRHVEGRNYVEILRELGRDSYDVVAMGALGLGTRQRTLIGGVAERVLRRAPVDALLVRPAQPESRGVMVAVDGSSCSFQAVETALYLGRALSQPVEVVTVFDPQFHIVAFRSITQVLSREASKLFRFQDQQKLHEEIIDKGLEKLYRGYLDVAAGMAEQAGQQVATTLLTGKPFQRVLDHAGQRNCAVLVVGRFGLHRTEYADLGNTSENVARLAGCSVLVVAGELASPPEQPAPAEAAPGIAWTPEAETRLQNVPPFARGMARQAIEDYARGQGYAAITPAVMSEARQKVGM
ncbi:MAG: universal stress protein [Chloroflexi bacterium]|nr:universal stress protein [Chloroflexota bacterium]